VPGKNPRTKSTAQFIAQARDKHGEKFDYSQVRYVNAKTHVRIGCPKHGWSEQLPHVHLTGSGCPRCRYERMAKSRARPWGDVLQQFREVHADRYDYSQVRYANLTRKITIVCREHGPFRQRPYCHAAGHGCPRCKYERFSAAQRLSLEEILQRFREVHGDRYDYSRVVQVKNCTHQVTIVCSAHGPFRQSVAHHARGAGCPACGESRGERRVARTLDRLGRAYIREKRFDTCRDVRPLPFDFFLPAERTLIEYDGRQHFVESDRFDLVAIQRHDAIKTDWAQRHGMRLLRIPYHRFHAIPQILTAEFTQS
jgi:very-short-patch-repair endonuclease